MLAAVQRNIKTNRETGAPQPFRMSRSVEPSRAVDMDAEGVLIARLQQGDRDASYTQRHNRRGNSLCVPHELTARSRNRR